MTSNSVAAPLGSFDGETPRRIHRSRQPWAGLELGPKERASQARLYPLQQLVLALGSCEIANRRLGLVACGEMDPFQVAKMYVSRSGHTRNVVAEVFRRAAKCGGSSPRMHFSAIAVEGVCVGAALTENESDRWPNSKDYPRAAAMLKLIGTDRCIWTVKRKSGETDHHGRITTSGGVDLCGRSRVDERGSRWCADHFHAGRSFDRNDRESITALLQAAGKALGPVAPEPSREMLEVRNLCISARR